MSTKPGCHTIHLNISNCSLQGLPSHTEFLNINSITTKELGILMMIPPIQSKTFFEEIDKCLCLFPLTLKDKMCVIGHQNKCKDIHFKSERRNGNIIHTCNQIRFIIEPQTGFKMICRNQKELHNN